MPFYKQAAGSSPLARGTRVMAKYKVECQRFIPTRAGNTGHRHGLGSRGPVHPHSRGEHVSADDVMSTEFGSSPLARGTPL